MSIRDGWRALRLVEALEALAPDRVAEQVDHLAHHALRGEVWGRAVTRCQQARSELATAIELSRAMEMAFWLPEAEAALAQVEGR
jgi:hypothetical protein